jgi:hypothetical protein
VPLVLVEVQLLEGSSAGLDEAVLLVKNWFGMTDVVGSAAKVGPAPVPEEFKALFTPVDDSLTASSETSI